MRLWSQEFPDFLLSSDRRAHLSDVQKLKSQIHSMQSIIAEQGQEIQKLNAHIARLAESDLVFVENKKLIEANRKLQTEYILFMNHDITKTFSRWFINHWENGCDTAEMIARLYQWCYAYLTDYMHPCVVIGIIVLITTGFIAIGFVLIRTVFDWIGEKWHDATIKEPVKKFL